MILYPDKKNGYGICSWPNSLNYEGDREYAILNWVSVREYFMRSHGSSLKFVIELLRTHIKVNRF